MFGVEASDAGSSWPRAIIPSTRNPRSALMYALRPTVRASTGRHSPDAEHSHAINIQITAAPLAEAEPAAIPHDDVIGDLQRDNPRCGPDLCRHIEVCAGRARLGHTACQNVALLL